MSSNLFFPPKPHDLRQGALIVTTQDYIVPLGKHIMLVAEGSLSINGEVVLSDSDVGHVVVGANQTYIVPTGYSFDGCSVTANNTSGFPVKLGSGGSYTVGNSHTLLGYITRIEPPTSSATTFWLPEGTQLTGTARKVIVEYDNID